MARLYPSPLPTDIRRDPKRAAEVEVYDALAATLDDGFLVFHGVAWLARWPSGRAGDGETDFVIVHPEYGLLVIEVKGGAISRFGPTGDWAGGEGTDVWPIRNPFEQAKNAKYALKQKLERHPAFGGQAPGMGHAVVLTGANDPGFDLGPEAPREVIVFAPDVARMGERVGQIFRFWRSKDRHRVPLNEKRLAALAQVFAPTLDLRLPLGQRLARIDRELVHLSDEQVRVLDMFKRNRRVAVSGGAGTGKTLLAIERARQLAAEGFDVLLTCFNRPLADHLRQMCAGAERLSVFNFHQLCWHWATEARVALEDPNRRDLDPAYFQEMLPLALDRAIDLLPHRFDAIVVDEGQDFLDSWWPPLLRTLADPARGVLYVFYDDNQQVYQRVGSFPDGMAEVHLSRNFRNTRCIHREAMRFYQGEPVEAVGPEGGPAERVAVASGDEVEGALGALLERLTTTDRVAPGDIVVLTGSTSSPLRRDGFIGRCAVSSHEDGDASAVLVESIRRFKGLERPVVVLAGLESVDPEEARGLMYVGVSRARTHLVAVATAETLRRLDL